MEKIGSIIRNHRIAKGLTQEELGNKVFVSKQAVSKWETGKTLPDLEMIRKLCQILEISNDQILGGSIDETVKNRTRLKACTAFSVICLLVALFFGLGGWNYIDRHTQSGVAYISVFFDGELISTDEYQVTTTLKSDDLKNGYRFAIDYGEVRGTLSLPNLCDIDFGFVNTNNWHNIHIRLDIGDQHGQFLVKQTISYETDNNTYHVIVTEKISSENSLSVFHGGV